MKENNFIIIIKKMKIIFFIWKFFLPNILKLKIKQIYVEKKFKTNMNINCFNNLTLDYLMSWDIKIWKEVNIGENNFFQWKIEIWDYTYLNTWNNKISWCKDFKIKIWKFCSIAWNVSIINHNYHDYNKLTTSDTKILHLYNKNNWWDIIIWNDVWIWANVVILPNVKIWNWAIIWAWTIVTKDVPKYSIFVWNPWKIIKLRFDEDIINKVESSKWWNWEINKIKNNLNLEFINNLK